MTRVNYVVNKARIILADKDIDSYRWTDDDLIANYNECLLDIAISSDILRKVKYVELSKGVSVYNIGDDVLLIHRIEYDNSPLSLETHASMDYRDSEWTTKEGADIEAYILDLTKPSEVILYPILSEAAADPTTAIEIVNDGGLYGAIGEIEIILDDPITVKSLQEALLFQKYMVVYYSKIPKKISIDTTDFELEFSVMWDEAIAHFIAGMSLRNDGDQQNRAMGSEELQLYGAHIAKIGSKAAASYSGKPDYQTPYFKGY